jgi:hypothetical protein
MVAIGGQSPRQQQRDPRLLLGLMGSLGVDELPCEVRQLDQIDVGQRHVHDHSTLRLLRPAHICR